MLICFLESWTYVHLLKWNVLLFDDKMPPQLSIETSLINNK